MTNLNETILEAAAFFKQIDGDLYDGYQTAYEVLAHLVFWHRVYCTISQSLLQEQKLDLLRGSLAELNEQAAVEFEGTSMAELANYLIDYQKIFSAQLRRLPSWEINFPFKSGCRYADVAKRLRTINKHIQHHLTRQKRAQERGKAWVEAYYS